jgi:hypothetical protein
MTHSTFDHVVSDSTTADRRSAVRRLGALGMAVLAALGLADGSAKRKRRPKRKPGPPGPSGPPGAVGPTWESTRVFGDPSPTLGVLVGNSVHSTADCGAPGKLLGGGYTVFFNGATILANVIVQEVAVDAFVRTFTVELIRTANVGSPGGVGVRAVAICRP